MAREHELKFLDKNGELQTVKALTPKEGEPWPPPRQKRRRTSQRTGDGKSKKQTPDETK